MDFGLSEFASVVPATEPFDVIVIDGLYRSVAVTKSLGLLAADGACIFDDSEDEYDPVSEGNLVMNTFRAAGYLRIDFHGFSAANVRPHCTSLFFRGHCFLLEGSDNPRLGENWL